LRSQRRDQQLADAQAVTVYRVVIPVRRADLECAGAGAAGKTGGFGIEEQQVAWIDRLTVTLGEVQRECIGRSGEGEVRLDQAQARRDLLPGQRAVNRADRI